MKAEHDYPAKDLHLTVRVRNAAMVRWRRELGITRKAAAELAGVSNSIWGNYEALKINPVSTRKGLGRVFPEWKPTAVKIADTMKMLPEDVFTEGVRSVVKTRIEVEVNSEELSSRLADVSTMRHRIAYSPDPEAMLRKKEIGEALAGELQTLTKMQQQVIRRRFWDEVDLDVVAVELGVTSERVRQLEKIALRKLRHPSRTKSIREAGGGDPEGDSPW